MSNASKYTALQWWGAVIDEISGNTEGRAERDGKLRYPLAVAEENQTLSSLNSQASWCDGR